MSPAEQACGRGSDTLVSEKSTHGGATQCPLAGTWLGVFFRRVLASLLLRPGRVLDTRPPGARRRRGQAAAPLHMRPLPTPLMSPEDVQGNESHIFNSNCSVASST